MYSFKLILGVAALVLIFVGSSDCKQQVRSTIKAKQDQNGSKTNNKGKNGANMDSHNKDFGSNSPSTKAHKNKEGNSHQKSGIKTRSAENKEKKYSLYQPKDTGSFGQDGSTQQQYYTSPYAGQSQDSTSAQGYPMLNGGQEGLSKYQGGGEANGQNIGMLQSLMEQRAAMYGQEEGNQEGEQRSYGQQQISAYQGQEQQNEEQGQPQQQEEQQQGPQEEQGPQQPQEGPQQDEQQGQAPEETQQYQQNMYREGQQQEVQGQEGREGQEFRMQQEEEGGQPGNPQIAAAYQQESEQSQMQEQQPGPENEQPQQQGEQEAGYAMKEGAQYQSYKAGEDSREGYQKEPEESREGYQQGGAEEMQPQPEPNVHGIDGGSISNIFADANNQNGQDTQSIIKEGQSITSSDAAQLAEAIANANKGLKGFKSLSNAASDSNSALSFTGSEAIGQQQGKKEDGEMQEGTNMLFPEPQPFNGEFPSSPSMQNGPGIDSNYEKGPEFSSEQEYHHEHHGGEQEAAYHEEGPRPFHEESPHFIQAEPFQHHEACTGCPRNSRCIDKVCIINGDEPLARILGALSGPDNHTDDCKGCHHNARCVKKECICKPGFNGNGTICKADSCLPGCSKHGKCIRGFCVCDHSHYFDGNECAPYKISQTECPPMCKEKCVAHCPEKCCKDSESIDGKKEASDTASTFFLKPTMDHALDVFHKHPSHGKETDEKNQPESNAVHTNPTKAVNDNVEPTTPSTDKNTQPSLKVNQMDFLKSIAEKFCPTACQKSCNSGCPPVCCDKKTLASILTGSPGTSMVDMSKANDVFRNAMGWFGMMNLIHMMYTMYGKNNNNNNPTLSVSFPGAMKPTIPLNIPGIKKLVTPTTPLADHKCLPICKKECLPKCPDSCCAVNASKRTGSTIQKSLNKPGTAKSEIHFTTSPLGRSPTRPQNRALPTTQALSRPESHQAPGITRCPFICSRQCLPLCPVRCCKAATKSVVSAATARSCKPGCSPKCYPQCTAYCCKYLQKPKSVSKAGQVRPTTLSRYTRCPATCPKRCFPSCTPKCCSSKASVPATRGQYYVNIACPNECRPYNCLSYCHHECCLGKHVSRVMKVKSSIAVNPKKT